MSLAGSWPTILPQANIFAGPVVLTQYGGRSPCFPSAAAVCSNQPTIAAAAFTMDRKDAHRKDARRATRHYLDSRLLSQSRVESRTDDSLTTAGGRWTRRGTREFREPSYVRVCARTRVYVRNLRATPVGMAEGMIEEDPGSTRLTSDGITPRWSPRSSKYRNFGIRVQLGDENVLSEMFGTICC